MTTFVLVQFETGKWKNTCDIYDSKLIEEILGGKLNKGCGVKIRWTDEILYPANVIDFGSDFAVLERAMDEYVQSFNRKQRTTKRKTETNRKPKSAKKQKGSDEIEFRGGSPAPVEIENRSPDERQIIEGNGTVYEAVGDKDREQGTSQGDGSGEQQHSRRVETSDQQMKLLQTIIANQQEIMQRIERIENQLNNTGTHQNIIASDARQVKKSTNGKCKKYDFDQPTQQFMSEEQVDAMAEINISATGFARDLLEGVYPERRHLLNRCLELSDKNAGTRQPLTPEKFRFILSTTVRKFPSRTESIEGQVTKIKGTLYSKLREIKQTNEKKNKSNNVANSGEHVVHNANVTPPAPEMYTPPDYTQQDGMYYQNLAPAQYYYN